MARLFFLISVILCICFNIQRGLAESGQCCLPDVYTSGYSALVTEEFDEGPLVYTWVSEAAVNTEGKISGSILTISYDNGTIETTRQIIDYSKQVTWVIYGLRCYKYKYEGNLTRGCIPDDAVYEGSDKAAFSDIPLEVGSWSWWDGEDNGNYLIGNITVTRLLYDCRPVQELFFGRSKYDKDYYYTALSGTSFDYQYGILNPKKYFSVPQFCPEDFSSDRKIRMKHHRHMEFSPIHLLHRDFREYF